jgi:hypothetical protein
VSYSHRREVCLLWGGVRALLNFTLRIRVRWGQDSTLYKYYIKYLGASVVKGLILVGTR